MKKIILLVQTILLFNCFYITAQISNGINVPTIVPPSPTVANLMNFEEVPVDLYTGQPDISVPIYSKSLHGDLNLSIALKYTALGLRLESRSGWLGTGWSLDCGGVISRTVRGYPDEALGGFFYNQRGVFHNPDFWNYSNLTDTEKNRFIWNMAQNSLDKYDANPDLYQISIPGYTSRFVIVEENGQFRAKQLDMNQKLKISFTMNSLKSITSFEVIDPNGYKYNFGGTSTAIETTKTQTTSTAVNFDPDSPVFPVYDLNDIIAVNSSWMLTSITTSNHQLLATFEYENSTEVYDLPVSVTENSIAQATPTPHSWWVIQEDDSYNYGMLRMKKQWIFSKVTAETKKLTKITFRDKTSLQFTLSAEDSHPETNGRYLEGIGIYESVNNNNVLIRSFALSQTITQQGRLFLTFISSGPEWRYRFIYHDMDNFDSENDRIDAWGYTSGDYRDVAFNDYRPDAVKKGALHKMITKGDGVKEFGWEPHTFTFEGNKALSKLDNQVFDENPNNSSPAPAFSHLFNAPEITNTDVGSPLNITHKQYIQVMKNILPANTTLHPEIFEVAFVRNGVEVFTIPVQDLPAVRVIQKGTYTVKVKVRPGQNISDDGSLIGYINIFYYSLNSANYQNWLLGGGLRIGGITFYDNEEGPLEKKRNFNYRYKMLANITIRESELSVASSGAIDSKLGSMFRQYETIEERYFYKFARKTAVSDFINYTTKTNSPNTHLTRGGYVGYKRVIVSEGLVLNGNQTHTDVTPNGYTEYIYTSPIDEPAPVGVFEYPYIERPNLDLMRGLLKEKRTYNNLGIKLDETINLYQRVEFPIVPTYTIKPQPCKWIQFYKMTYDTYYTKQPTDYLICNHCGPNGGNCIPIDCFINIGYNNCGNLAPFDMINSSINAGYAQLVSSTYTQFFDGQSITKATSYAYNAQNYQIATKTETFKEGNEDIILKTEYQYPVGGYNTSFFDDPEEQAALSSMVDLNIINKPIVIYSYQNEEKLNTVVNVYKEFTPNQVLLHKVRTLKGGISGAMPEDRITYHAYNAIGNVLDVSMEGGIHTCYIWGYEDTLPVVKIDNSQGGYNSFSPNIMNKIDAIINESNTGTASAIETAFNDLRGVFTIDLLNNSKPALITSVVHHPVHGVLSMTDPRGLKTTFGYDYLSRLLWVKDTDGNLLTEYKYKFKGLF